MSEKKMKYERLKVEVVMFDDLSDNPSVLTADMLEGKENRCKEKDGKLEFELVDSEFSLNRYCDISCDRARRC